MSRPRSSSLALGLRLVAPPLITAGVVILAWYLILRLKVISPVIVAPIDDTAKAIADLIGSSLLWDAIGATLTETILGFTFGVSIGLLLGILAVTFKSFRDLVFPYAVLFQNSPRVALAPIFLIWFGFGLASKVAMSAAICFYPVAVNTMIGLTSADRDATSMLHSLGANRWQELWNLRIPTAAPLLVAALKNSMALALIGAIVAEFVSAARGLGVLIEQSTFEIATDRAFAALIILGIVGALLYFLLSIVGRRILYWLPRDVHDQM